MKPFKTAKEFEAMLDRALAEHEKRQLSNVSFKIILDVNNSTKGDSK